VAGESCEAGEGAEEGPCASSCESCGPCVSPKLLRGMSVSLVARRVWREREVDAPRIAVAEDARAVVVRLLVEPWRRSGRPAGERRLELDLDARRALLALVLVAGALRLEALEEELAVRGDERRLVAESALRLELLREGLVELLTLEDGERLLERAVLGLDLAVLGAELGELLGRLEVGLGRGRGGRFLAERRDLVGELLLVAATRDEVVLHVALRA